MEKSEILERFKFIKDIFNKVDKEDSVEELCGVFFYEGKAYTTNNHIIGRLSDNKGFPTDELLFFSYYKDMDMTKREWPKLKLKALSTFKENFIENIDYIFDSYTSNYFFVRKEDLLSILYDNCKNNSQRARTFVHIKIDKIFLNFSFFNRRGKVTAKSRLEIITNYDKTTRIIHGSSFSVNVLYLFQVVLQSFFDCDIIGFKLKGDDCNHPIIVFNKHNSLYRPAIHWSIAQTIIKIKQGISNKT
jgi:hypothetical protein